MRTLTYCPSGGHILDLAGQHPPTPLADRRRRTFRSLARRVAELATLESYERKRRDWYSHIDLTPGRPLLLVWPENSWNELLPVETDTIESPFWAQYEWYFRHLIFRHEHIDDDFIIEPTLLVPLVYRIGDWGLDPIRYTRTENAQGSFHWTPPLQVPRDIRKLRPASFEVDMAATHLRQEALQEAVGDILDVQLDCRLPEPCMGIYETAAQLRGIEQCMLDMYDRPEWLHELMSFLTDEALRRAGYLESGGYLTLNNRNHYTDSGGIGYTRRLPAVGRTGKEVGLKDRWHFASAQAASQVGPGQHEEFIFPYDLRLQKLAGLNACGCCEPYTHMFDLVKRIANLRRVSVSPWCDVEKAAEALQDKYVYSWKPNPSMLVGTLDLENIRRYIRRTLEVARGCCLEIILKDTITLCGEPSRLYGWIRIAREEIDRLWA